MVRKIKQFGGNHAEELFVVSFLLIVMFMLYLVTFKIAFLNLFFIPIILAGYYLSARTAVLTAFWSVLMINLILLLSPKSFQVQGMGNMSLFLSMVAWGSCLILTSAALGYLKLRTEHQSGELNKAYIGVLVIVSKYLETMNRQRKSHSIRVADLTEDIAMAMGIRAREIETMKTAALLHEVGITKAGKDLLNKAAFQPGIKKQLLSFYSEKEANILSLVGSLISEALPLLSAFHCYYSNNKHASSNFGKRIPMGATIIAAADAYDRIRTDMSDRAEKFSWKAFEEIEKDADTQYHREVVKALKLVLSKEERNYLEKAHVP